MKILYIDSTELIFHCEGNGSDVKEVAVFKNLQSVVSFFNQRQYFDLI